MYAITPSGFRAISAGILDIDLAPGEQRVEAVPQALLDLIAVGKKRMERDERLRATDWTQVSDAPLTALEKAAYQTYRQALRDLPGVPGFPDVPWPTLPTIRDGIASSGEGAVYP